jgi:hypothetical protein
MLELSPIITGGSGHSGTRIFNEILTHGGVFTGIRRITKWPESEDLKIIGLLTRWVRPYLLGDLSERDARRMRLAFDRRLRMYFPFRHSSWGFKNPRTLLILPFLHESFPAMKFVHVVRDGRDVSLGNEFAGRNPYADAFLSASEKRLPPEEKMILFWGRSNQRSMQYGRSHLGDRYLLMRWEDLCRQPEDQTKILLEFASLPTSRGGTIAQIVKRPKTIGRWQTYPEEMQARVLARGEYWLRMFGYI